MKDYSQDLLYCIRRNYVHHQVAEHLQMKYGFTPKMVLWLEKKKGVRFPHFSAGFVSRKEYLQKLSLDL